MKILYVLFLNNNFLFFKIYLFYLKDTLNGKMLNAKTTLIGFWNNNKLGPTPFWCLWFYVVIVWVHNDIWNISLSGANSKL